MRDFTNEEFLTVAEVAERLRLNPQTIRNWIDARTLPAVRIGRRVRVLGSDFEALVNSSYQPRGAERTESDGRAQGFWDGTWHPEPELRPPAGSGEG